jgi:hypothetical protein
MQRPAKNGHPRNAIFDDPELINMIRDLASQGLNRETICKLLRISRQTWDMHSEYNEQLAEVMADGRAMGENYAGMALLRKVKEGDLAAIKWFETSRGYRKPEAQFGEIKIAMSDEAVQSRIDELESKLKKIK